MGYKRTGLDETSSLRYMGLAELIKELPKSQAFNIKEGGSIIAGMTIHGGRVYFGANDRNFYCLRLSDGRELWRFRAGGIITSRNLDEGKGALYFVSFDGNLYWPSS